MFHSCDHISWIQLLLPCCFAQMSLPHSVYCHVSLVRASALFCLVSPVRRCLREALPCSPADDMFGRVSSTSHLLQRLGWVTLCLVWSCLASHLKQYLLCFGVFHEVRNGSTHCFAVFRGSCRHVWPCFRGMAACMPCKGVFRLCERRKPLPRFPMSRQPPLAVFCRMVLMAFLSLLCLALSNRAGVRSAQHPMAFTTFFIKIINSARSGIASSCVRVLRSRQKSRQMLPEAFRMPPR